MKIWRIRDTWYCVKARCAKEALRKLVDEDLDLVYRNHKGWTEFTTSYGYSGIIEVVR